MHASAFCDRHLDLAPLRALHLAYRNLTRPALMRLALIFLCLALSACSVRAPELDVALSTESRRADWPVLVPLGPLLAEREPLHERDVAELGTDLERRAASLRARAARLRALAL